MLSEPFTSILRSGRAEFNNRFALVRRMHPDLDGSAFANFLQRTADGIVLAVDRIRPDRTADVAMAAYDAGLELVGQKLAGPNARHHLIEEGWQRVLIQNVSLVASSPARVFAGVSNALHHLAGTPGARPLQWIADLEKLGPQCADVETFFRLGQVAAWRAGLAHYRQGAIAAADAMPEHLALAGVTAPETTQWKDLRNFLLVNPWYDPSGQNVGIPDSSPHFRVMTQAGTFRGFGGLFVEPPEVVEIGGHFLVRSGGECWLLTADLFGATFHRATPEEFESARVHSKLPSGLKVTGSTIIWKDARFETPSLGELTSAAANTTTLAITSALTHSVVLIALQ